MSTHDDDAPRPAREPFVPGDTTPELEPTTEHEPVTQLEPTTQVEPTAEHEPLTEHKPVTEYETAAERVPETVAVGTRDTEPIGSTQGAPTAVQDAPPAPPVAPSVTTPPVTTPPDAPAAGSRPGARPTTMALGIVLLVLAALAVVSEVSSLRVDGGAVVIVVMIGIGILFLVGSRRA